MAEKRCTTPTVYISDSQITYNGSTLYDRESPPRHQQPHIINGVYQPPRKRTTITESRSRFQLEHPEYLVTITTYIHGMCTCSERPRVEQVVQHVSCNLAEPGQYFPPVYFDLHPQPLTSHLSTSTLPISESGHGTDIMIVPQRSSSLRDRR